MYTAALSAHAGPRSRRLEYLPVYFGPTVVAVGDFEALHRTTQAHLGRAQLDTQGMGQILDTQFAIKVLAKPLGHVGNARTDTAPMIDLPHVTA